MSARDRANGRGIVAKHLREGGVYRADTADAFTAYLTQFGRTLDERNTAVLDEFTALAFESMVEGSPITNAPGVPQATGELHDSYEVVEEGPATRLIKTSVIHALAAEYNWGSVQYKNHGPHSRAITLHGAPRLLAVAHQRVVGGVA